MKKLNQEFSTASGIGTISSLIPVQNYRSVFFICVGKTFFAQAVWYEEKFLLIFLSIIKQVSTYFT